MYDSIQQNPDQKRGPKPLLSLAMIVKNGGQLFTELLQEASAWVDEIVIGDTGSSDGSAKAAASCGATVFEVPWNDDFSEARNAVLDQCQGRWILVLDADEKLAPQGWQEIRSWVQDRTEKRKFGALRLETRNYLPGRHSRRSWRPVPDPDPQGLPGGAPSPGYVPSLKIRLFANDHQIHFQGCLHETVESSVTTQAMACEELTVPVHHFGMMLSNPEKAHRYLHLARTKTQDDPHNAAAWGELSDCAIACGQMDEALHALDRALILEPANLPRRLAVGWLLKSAGRLEQADIQLSAVAGSAGVTDEQLAEACHLRAQIAMTSDEPVQQTRVAHLLGVALRLCPDNGHQWNTMGVWHLQNGRGEQACQALEKATGLLPGLADPWINLAVLYGAASQPDQALRCAQKALEAAPESEKAARMLEKMQTADTH